MVRHGSERFLHSPQSMHADYSAHVNNTNESPSMDLESSELATCTDNNSSTLKVNADNSVVYTTGSAPSTVPSPSVSSVSSSLDSRIPRPSPTGLRRSVSMRMRGERVSPNHPPPPPSTAVTAGLSRSYQQCRRFNLLHHQQHHHLDHRTFPVITENGTESPRQRSLVSILIFLVNRYQPSFMYILYKNCSKWFSYILLQYYAVSFVRCRSQMRADNCVLLTISRLHSVFV